MTAQKLLELLKFLDELDKKLRLQPNLETVKQSLDNLVGSPASPPHQAALASALENLSNSAMALGELLTPSRAAATKEIGSKEFIDPGVADRVKDSVQNNAMTPSVAKDFVERLVNARAAFLEPFEMEGAIWKSSIFKKRSQVKACLMSHSSSPESCPRIILECGGDKLETEMLQSRPC